ncbi:MAG: DnaJ domain-containing protein [Chlorobi bacterium]|nr:DnaJ domain-containing protein [Chlorobiota bacterium]
MKKIIDVKYYFAVFITVFLFFIFFFNLIASYLGLNYYIVILWIRISFGVLATALFILYFRRRKGELFGKIDRYIFLIMLSFLNIKEMNDEEKLKLLKQIFCSYSENQLTKLFNRYIIKKIHIDNLCFELKNTETKIKIFIIYSLFNLASYDKVLEKDEESFILNVSKLLLIPKQTYHTIKNIYRKKGLTDEEEIKRKQAYQKFNKSFSSFMLPYEAYRIMGVSPSVTKVQLKKAYRTLAKKYHPDKFAGQSAEIIKNAEKKFQEIKEAYDTIS